MNGCSPNFRKVANLYVCFNLKFKLFRLATFKAKNRAALMKWVIKNRITVYFLCINKKSFRILKDLNFNLSKR